MNESLLNNYIHDAEHTIQKILQCRAKFFTKFDLKSAFFFIELGP